MLGDFFESVACTSGVHCAACRSEGPTGDAFRAAKSKRHGLPILFECPAERGAKPWGWKQSDAPPKPPRITGPGSVVSCVLKSIGYTRHAGCGCAAFAAQMNAWGWRGCVRHRAEIVAWFTAKAREQGIDVARESLWAIVRGGLKDVLRKNKPTEPANG